MKYKKLEDINKRNVRRVGEFLLTYDDEGCYLIDYLGDDTKIALPEDTFLKPYYVIPGCFKQKAIEEIYIPDCAFVCAEALNFEYLKAIYTVKNEIEFTTDAGYEAYKKAKGSSLDIYIVREHKDFILDVALKCKEFNDYSPIFIKRNFNITHHRATNIIKFLKEKEIIEAGFISKTIEEIKNIILDSNYEVTI